MTDPYITEITSALSRLTDELKSMRRDVATKAEINNLQADLATLLGFAAKFDSRMERRPTDMLPATNPPTPGLQERVNTVASKMLDRIEALESDVKAIWLLLRPAETGETRTRLDTFSKTVTSDRRQFNSVSR